MAGVQALGPVGVLVGVLGLDLVAVVDLAHGVAVAECGVATEAFGEAISQ